MASSNSSINNISTRVPAYVQTSSNTTPTNKNADTKSKYFKEPCSQNEIESDISLKNVQQFVRKFLKPLENISLGQLQSESFKKNVQHFVDNLSGLRVMVGEKAHEIKNAVNLFVQKVIKSVFDSISSWSSKTEGALEKLAGKLRSLVNKLSENLKKFMDQPIVKAIIATALAVALTVLISILIGGIGFIISNPITLGAMLLLAFIGFVMYYTLFDNLSDDEQATIAKTGITLPSQTYVTPDNWLDNDIKAAVNDF